MRNLPSLGNGKSRMDLKAGSIVIVRDEHQPRLKWPLARVVRLHKGKDGLVRLVCLKTERGEMIRPVQKLHRLEVSDFEVNEVQSDEAETPGIRNVSSRSGRVVRPPKILDL